MLGPRSIGARGERRAARWLRRRGYVILARNLRLGRDEADIVALSPDRRTVAIIEVKTRRRDHPAPEEQVDHRKRRRMTRLATRLRHRGALPDGPIRFDVVAVVWPEGKRPVIRHHEGAFDSTS